MNVDTLGKLKKTELVFLCREKGSIQNFLFRRHVLHNPVFLIAIRFFSHLTQNIKAGSGIFSSIGSSLVSNRITSSDFFPEIKIN